MSALSCGGTTTSEQTFGPEAVRCQLMVGGVPANLSHTASNVALTVSAARDCTWSASTDAAWVQVSPAAGQGEATITATVAANAQTRPRSAVIAVNDTRVTVNQDGVPCVYEVNTREIRFGVDGGRRSIQVSTTDACEWRAASSESWVRVLTDRGTGIGAVDIEVVRNTGSERSATIAIANTSVAVIQQDASSPPPPPVACYFTIDAESASFPSAGGSGAVRISTEPGCAWTATSEVAWVSLSRTSGTGPDVVPYQVSANTSTTSDRRGGLLVGGQAHRIDQRACPLSLDPPSRSFAAPGGPGSVRVVTDPGCTWSAASSSEWIALGRSGGAGPETIPYVVAIYTATSTPRSGAVTVSGRTHAVSQAAFLEEEIAGEGVLTDVTGSCPNFTFTLGGRVFVTDQRTRFDVECSKIRNGARAFVRGRLMPDGRVIATQVDVDD